MIKKQRKKRNLTQLQVSKKLGIDFSYLSRLENYPKTFSPSVDLVFRLSEELGLDIGQLLYFFFKKDEKKYSTLVSGLVTKKVFDKLTQDAESRDCSISDIVSEILNNHYN